jgi:hypothetical protein
VFLSLDFLYAPAPDFEATLRYYTGVVGAELFWKVRAMGTVVASLRLAEDGPELLLAEHLAGGGPILVYRVASYRAAVDRLRAAGVTGGEELEIPHGPCFAFEGPGGQRLAVYELVRPEVAAHFAGRVDP